MKKKLFAMYALVGALVASPVFTSCIDDSESASVTAIRNAKAEQLKASAALSLAQAEFQKAQTALKEAELAAKLADNEQDKALFEYELATAKAEYEKKALEYEKTKLEYLQSMANIENEMISNAANKYTGALDELNSLNKKLVEAKSDLAIIGIDSAKNVALFNEYIATQNKTIAEATAKIERIKAYKGDSKEALYQKMQTVVSNFQNLNVEWSAANDAKTAANTAYSDAKTAYDNTAASKLEYVKAINALRAIASPYTFTITAETDNYDVYNGTTLTSTQYTKSYSAVLESQVLAYTQSLNAALKTAKDNLGAAKTDAAAATGGYAVLEALETALKTAKDGLAATPATHNQAQVDAAELLLAQYKDDATSTRDYDGDSNVDAGFAYLQNEVKKVEKAIADFEALLAKVKEGSDEHKEWVAAQEALLAAAEAYNEAFDKEAELKKAKEATGINSVSTNSVGEASVTPGSTGEYVTLDALYNGIEDANTMIAALEADIAEAKANIEKGMSSTYTETVAVVERYWDPVAGDWIYCNSTTQIATHIYGVDTEDLKALAEDKIAAIEAKIEVQETLVAKYKAELEALLAEEEA